MTGGGLRRTFARAWDTKHDRLLETAPTRPGTVDKESSLPIRHQGAMGQPMAHKLTLRRVHPP